MFGISLFLSWENLSIWQWGYYDIITWSCSQQHFWKVLFLFSKKIKNESLSCLKKILKTLKKYLKILGLSPQFLKSREGLEPPYFEMQYFGKLLPNIWYTPTENAKIDIKNHDMRSRRRRSKETSAPQAKFFENWPHNHGFRYFLYEL